MQRVRQHRGRRYPENGKNAFLGDRPGGFLAAFLCCQAAYRGNRDPHSLSFGLLHCAFCFILLFIFGLPRIFPGKTQYAAYGPLADPGSFGQTGFWYFARMAPLPKADRVRCSGDFSMAGDPSTSSAEDITALGCGGRFGRLLQHPLRSAVYPSSVPKQRLCGGRPLFSQGRQDAVADSIAYCSYLSVRQSYNSD